MPIFSGKSTQTNNKTFIYLTIYSREKKISEDLLNTKHISAMKKKEKENNLQFLIKLRLKNDEWVIQLMSQPFVIGTSLPPLVLFVCYCINLRTKFR